MQKENKMKSETRATNLAATGTNRLTLAEIREAKQRLEQEEAEIIKAEKIAREQQKQRTIAAALNSVEPTLQPAKAAFDQANAELAEAVSRIKEIARARDAAAEQLKSEVRRVRLNLSNAGISLEQINKAVASYESNRKAVAILANQISFAKPFSDGLLEIERRQHWHQVEGAQSLVVCITRRAG
jgi:predicted  nucleic acid-binding Zn-ribbon protein